MLSRYTRAAMGRIWSEDARLARWLEIELALTDVLAEPITFGLKCASWWAELGRDRRRLAAARKGIAYGKLSGAVGTFANHDPAVERAVCMRLGLKAEPIATQVIPVTATRSSSPAS